MKRTYAISGMTCSGCAGVVRNVLSAVPGVEEVTVSLEDNEAIVEASGEIPLAELEAALAKTPYRISASEAAGDQG